MARCRDHLVTGPDTCVSLIYLKPHPLCASRITRAEGVVVVRQCFHLPNRNHQPCGRTKKIFSSHCRVCFFGSALLACVHGRLHKLVRDR